MLERLCVQNFGCLDENVDSISFTQETVLIGPNNSGKSTFIAGLNLFRIFVIAGTIHWSNLLYDFVDRLEAVHKHETSREIRITVASDNKTSTLIISSEIKTVTLDRNPKYIEEMKRIWYLRPNRTLIPYRSDIRYPLEVSEQPLRPDGSNVIHFLLEKFNERDPNWDVAEQWFKKIDPEISSVRTRILTQRTQTFFETLVKTLPINASFQGSGFQSVASIISAVVFSPKGSTIIIEEPEICLHKKSQEAIVDLFNDAVNNQGKQIIFSTHSWDMLLPFISDVGRGAKRGRQHVNADPEKFSLFAFNKSEGHVRIEPIDLGNMKVSDVKQYLKKLWG